jgi:hypothetical protein
MQMKLAFVSVAFPLFMVATVVPAMSQTREQQQAACEDDAYRLCPDQIPDETEIRKCLEKRKASLSPACRAQFKIESRHRRAD